MGNESQQVLNRTVDGDMLWVMLDGLMAESGYRVQVAAVTSAGVGVYSQPVFIFLSEYYFKLIVLKHPSCFLAGQQLVIRW